MASYMYDAIEDAVRCPLEVEVDFWHRFLGWVPRMPDPPIRTSTDQEAKGDTHHEAAPRGGEPAGLAGPPMLVAPASAHRTDTAGPEEKSMNQAIVSLQESNLDRARTASTEGINSR
jgi:hypothetical protein